MTEPVEARPCPFCGMEPFTRERGPTGFTIIQCRHDACEVGPSVSAMTRAEALRMWNVRA
jgi:hypothetical protein